MSSSKLLISRDVNKFVSSNVLKYLNVQNQNNENSLAIQLCAESISVSTKIVTQINNEAPCEQRPYNIAMIGTLYQFFTFAISIKICRL